MKLILVDPNPSLCQAWAERFDGLPDVQVVRGLFEELPEFDCMVSAANSFGLMDGGVDGAITRFFGPGLMANVQRRILEDYLGEQPVGTSFVVGTGHPKHPFLAHTPTMRVPMPIARTDNVYLAMWAMLRAVHHYSRAAEGKIGTVACPGLGSGYGRVPAEEAARQMALAYEHYLSPPSQIDWPYATRRQQRIGRGGDIAISFEKQP